MFLYFLIVDTTLNQMYIKNAAKDEYTAFIHSVI